MLRSALQHTTERLCNRLPRRAGQVVPSRIFWGPEGGNWVHTGCVLVIPLELSSQPLRTSSRLPFPTLWIKTCRYALSRKSMERGLDSTKSAQQLLSCKQKGPASFVGTSGRFAYHWRPAGWISDFGYVAPKQSAFSTAALPLRFERLARSLHCQVFGGYGLWPVPWLKGFDLRGVLWPTERWLLVSGVLRNSLCWLPDFVAGSLRPGRWAAVAVVNSINIVGPHLPRVIGLLLAQLIHTTRGGSAQALNRDTLYPWKELQITQQRPIGHSLLSASMQKGLNSVYNWWRLFWILLVFAPLLLTAPFAVANKWWCQYLRETLERCGPAFIKWGQWAATRRDLFPLQVCHELEKLQVQAPAHSFEVTRSTVEETFGFRLDELFAKFDEKPLASGSIGQVHKAVLGDIGEIITGMPAGTSVAVKVRHPNVDTAFEKDMALMLMLSHWLSAIPYLKGLKLEETLKQFAAPMREQVDLCIEAANLSCFQHNFRKTSSVTFPQPLFPLVAPNILVETFHEGRSVQEVVNENRSPVLDHKLAELGSSTFFEMILIHNLLHADLHPGNILVELGPADGLISRFAGCICNSLKHLGKGMEKGSLVVRLGEWCTRATKNGLGQEYHIVLLDAGMAAQLSDMERKLMIDLFRAFADMDGQAAAEATLKFAGSEQSCPDPGSFRHDLKSHFKVLAEADDWAETHFESGVEALAKVLDLVRCHQVVLPGEICSCLFTVFVLEGWSSKLDPDHSVMEQVKHMVRRWDSSLKAIIGDTMAKQWLPGDQRLAVV